MERRTWLGLAASESCSNHFPLGRTSDRLADFRAEIPAANARDPPPRIDRSTRKIFLPSRYLAPMPINRARVSLDGSLSRVVSIYCVLVSFLSYFLFLFFFFLHFFPPFPLFYETGSLSLSKKKDRFFSTQEIIPD